MCTLVKSPCFYGCSPAESTVVRRVSPGTAVVREGDDHATGRPDEATVIVMVSKFNKAYLLWLKFSTKYGMRIDFNIYISLRCCMYCVDYHHPNIAEALCC